MKNDRIIILVLLLLAFSCRKPYTPAPITTVTNYLVVEGVINTGNDATVIKLSRTVNISATITNVPELKAQVVIQDDQNQAYPVPEVGSGTYASAILNLDITRNYRLSVTTADGKNYLSDFVPAKQSPPIDSIGFYIKNNAMQVYVNTHDPANKTRYYRWDFEETWSFHAMYYSQYVSTGDTVIARSQDQQIYQCWASGISNNIVLGSSAKLTSDVIYQAPLTAVPSTSEKVETKYSILVRQYALTPDAYTYFDLLKKNTEQLGTIFDAQPSQLTGNIHCPADLSIPVIGYITAGSIQQKRVFISRDQLPNWRATYPYECSLDTDYYFNPKTKLNDVQLVLLNGSALAIDGIFVMGSSQPIGFTASDYDCADCSIRGTLVKPPFWQ